jgi:hypothetical protein
MSRPSLNNRIHGTWFQDGKEVQSNARAKGCTQPDRRPRGHSSDGRTNRPHPRSDSHTPAGRCVRDAQSAEVQPQRRHARRDRSVAPTHPEERGSMHPRLARILAGITFGWLVALLLAGPAAAAAPDKPVRPPHAPAAVHAPGKSPGDPNASPAPPRTPQPRPTKHKIPGADLSPRAYLLIGLGTILVVMIAHYQKNRNA